MQQIMKNYIERAKTLAHVMTSSSNVKVTISGSTAFCSYGHINIPMGDFSNPDFLKMVRGWIDHELGHEDETRKSDTLAASNNPNLAKLFNIVEDIRMEKSRGKKYRGVKLNLAVLAELAVKHGLFCESCPEDTAIQLIEDLVLYHGRAFVINQHCLDGHAITARRLLSNACGNTWTDALVGMVDDIDNASNSSDSLRIANDILAHLQQHQDEQPQQDDDNDDSSDDANDSESDGAGDSGQTSDPTDESCDEPSGNDGDSSDTSDDANTDNDAPSSSNDGDNSGSDNQTNDGNDNEETTGKTASDDANSTPSSQAKQTSDSASGPLDTVAHQSLQQASLVDQLSQHDMEDFHDKLAKLLTDQSADFDDVVEGWVPTKMVLDNNAYDTSAKNLDQVSAKRISGSIFQAMSRVLIDQQPSLPIIRNRGNRLMKTRISSIAAGNTQVFRQRIEQPDVSAAISIVVDASPSMRRDNDGVEYMTHANTCALAFALALDKAGIASEVTYYGSYSGVSGTLLASVPKRFSDKVFAKRFSICAGNYGTPTGEAMDFALQSLVLREEQKKMMLVLTDGEADSARDVVQARQMAQRFGVKVIPFGICTMAVSGFYADEFVVVDNPSELSRSVKEAVKLKLFS